MLLIFWTRHHKQRRLRYRVVIRLGNASEPRPGLGHAFYCEGRPLRLSLPYVFCYLGIDPALGAADVFPLTLFVHRCLWLYLHLFATPSVQTSTRQKVKPQFGLWLRFSVSQKPWIPFLSRP